MIQFISFRVMHNCILLIEVRFRLLVSSSIVFFDVCFLQPMLCYGAQELCHRRAQVVSFLSVLNMACALLTDFVDKRRSKHVGTYINCVINVVNCRRCLAGLVVETMKVVPPLQARGVFRPRIVEDRIIPPRWGLCFTC